MKRKRLQKMIALAACTAVITTMGGFSVAAEEVYEVAADEETVTDVPAEPETEDIFQEVGEDEEQLLQQSQEENEEADVLFGDGTVIEEFLFRRSNNGYSIWKSEQGISGSCRWFRCQQRRSQ